MTMNKFLPIALIAGTFTSMLPQQPQTLPYVGAQLMCYSTAWSGPRPCIVANHLLPGITSAEVVVFCDPVHDARMLAAQPLSSVEVYNALSQDVRATTLAGTPIRTVNGQQMQVICEWAK